MDSLTVLYLVADNTLFIESPLQSNANQNLRKSRVLRRAGLQLLVMATILLTHVYSAFALQLGERGIAVSQLQQTLQSAGYYQGPITGYYGAITQAAIRRFQASHGLKADGIAGPETLRVLRSITHSTQSEWDFSMSLRFGSNGGGVVHLQQNLQVLGYYNGSITGYYGAATQAAVKRFQAIMRLRQTGVADANTLAVLEAEIYELGMSNYPVLTDPTPSRGRMRQY
ncbi:MAG: peptidoglycan-binding protein [Microcoleaceae cyanobacterium]